MSSLIDVIRSFGSLSTSPNDR